MLPFVDRIEDMHLRVRLLTLSIAYQSRQCVDKRERKNRRDISRNEEEGEKAHR
jgi:hypothetical protein